MNPPDLTAADLPTRRSNHSPRRTLLVCWGLGLLALVTAGHASAETAAGYKLQGRYLVNFTEFVDWPPRTFATRASPILIGVLGEDPFGDVLDEILKNRLVNGRRLEIKRSRTVDDLKACQVLYISNSEKAHQVQLLATLAGQPVLTVSDLDEFLARGGMIRFRVHRQKVRFSVNIAAAERAGLKIDSQLLNLVRREEGAD